MWFVRLSMKFATWLQNKAWSRKHRRFTKGKRWHKTIWKPNHLKNISQIGSINPQVIKEEKIRKSLKLHYLGFDVVYEMIPIEEINRLAVPPQLLGQTFPHSRLPGKLTFFSVCRSRPACQVIWWFFTNPRSGSRNYRTILEKNLQVGYSIYFFGGAHIPYISFANPKTSTSVCIVARQAPAAPQ